MICMAKKKINLWAIIAFVLGILLLSVVVYISVSKYKQSREAEKAVIFQQGAQYGYQTAVVQMMQNAEGCKPVNVSLQNRTMQMMDVSCFIGGQLVNSGK